MYLLSPEHPPTDTTTPTATAQEHVLAPAAPSARQARAIVRRALAARGLDTFSDAAELLVSELVTNACCHGYGAVRLVLCFGPEELHCEVHDESPATHTAREAGDGDEHGRGMLLLQALAHAWGVRAEESGKAVWFDLGPEAAL
ncbi:ATP-binding protein [Streptomyces sp. NPDC053513]|uniref:ATP-binding protein n=1 Tax=unclassified Streptomyces TaxID=2593676 RepID=UPI0037D70242